jgi:hypothetical protein
VTIPLKWAGMLHNRLLKNDYDRQNYTKQRGAIRTTFGFIGVIWVFVGLVS